METRRLKQFAVRARKELVELCGSADRETFRWSLFMDYVFDRFDPSGPRFISEDVEFRPSLKKKLGALADALTQPEDWKSVESCGWLHQFFIAGRKERNRQGIVKADDLAASTQLFTPDWIADYLIQNSLGERLREIVRETSSQANKTQRIEKIKRVTFLDPSCGTGHLLLAAYDLFYEIYRELGVDEKEIPNIVLSRNLFGLDLDDSAVLVARNILAIKAKRSETTPQIYSFPIITAKDQAVLSASLLDEAGSVTRLLEFYQENGFAGSLLSIPKSIQNELKRLRSLRRILSSDPLSRRLRDAIDLTELLASRFDCVVTNPPYLGLKGISASLKNFVAKEGYRGAGNLYSLFIERSAHFARRGGRVGIIAMQSWLFLPTFEEFRRRFLAHKTLTTLAHLGTGCFAEIPGEVVATAAFCFRNQAPPPDHVPVFFRLIDGNAQSKRERLIAGQNRFSHFRQSDFLKSSDAAIRYWIDDRLRETLNRGPTLGNLFDLRQGLATGENRRFLRRWFEVKKDAIFYVARNRNDAVKSGKKWFPYNKGDGCQRWFGGGEFVVDWEDDGRLLRENRPKSVIRNPDYYFRTGVTWSLVGSGSLSPRALPPGGLFDVGGSSLFVKKGPQSDLTEEETLDLALGFLGSQTATEILKTINPTMNYQVGDLARLPFDLRRVTEQKTIISKTVRELVALARQDRAAREVSSDFVASPLVTSRQPNDTLAETVARMIKNTQKRIDRVQSLEKRNNEIFARLYGLKEEIPNEWSPGHCQRSKPIADFLSYFIGVLLGRFDLPTVRQPFSPTWRQIRDEGFLITSSGTSNGKNRLVPLLSEFISLLWSPESLDANLCFLADGIGNFTKKNAEERLDSYFTGPFYEDHFKRYYHLPIYWRLSDFLPKEKKRKKKEPDSDRLEPDALIYYHRIDGRLFQKLRDELLKQAGSSKIDPLIRTLNRLIEEKFSFDFDAGIATNRQRFELLMK